MRFLSSNAVPKTLTLSDIKEATGKDTALHLCIKALEGTWKKVLKQDTDPEMCKTLQGLYKEVVANRDIIFTSSSREYYIFSSPPCVIIFSRNSEKISSHVSVNETKSGQPNKHHFSLTFRELNG